MVLNGALDAAVNGGIEKYKNAFLSSEYKKNNPLENEQIESNIYNLDNLLKLNILTKFFRVEILH